ncbi:dehydrogenase/reductase SDR family member 7C-B [Engraulis encrasicolus]|uniref:dehydrogenase/reductase SDR family member 7C-B n=1 Tax=Engraulis encrasicolus TaxID=184585 RepID=UPI002FD503AA
MAEEEASVSNGTLWTTVLIVPAVIVLTAGFFYVYNAVLSLMTKTSLRNKVVVITDALSGLGTECAKIFHKDGARLILCGQSWEKLESLSQKLSEDCDPTLTFPTKLVMVDFGDMDSLPEVIVEVMECYGCLDILIINSSMKIKAPVQDTSLELDHAVMDMNYFGPTTLAKGVLPSMISRRGGHILLINSIQGKLALPFRTTYAASKHAVQAFFDCLRAEVQEYGISVSTISHTFISGPPGTKEDATAKSASSPSQYLGITINEMVGEIVKILSSKKKEVVLARTLSKAAIYARALLPNLVFSVTAAGVQGKAP